MKMASVVLWEPGRATVEQVERPDPGADEVVVKVGAAGVCGTDVKIFDGTYLSPYPLTPGHEIAGEVASVGSAVDPEWLGVAVGVDPTLACGQCDFCRARQANHCLHWAAIGDTVNGGFAEYVVVPERNLFRLPRGLSASQGALIEPLACAVWALERIPLRPGADVLLYGIGPMGVLLMRLLGPDRVVAVDPSAERRAYGTRFGARQVTTPDAVCALREAYPYGFDLVVDATGSPRVMPEALRQVRKGGDFLLFGVAPQGETVAVEPYWLYHQEVTVHSSMAINQSYSRAVELAGRGVLPEGIVSATLPLAAYSEAIARIRRGEGLKVQIVPGA